MRRNYFAIMLGILSQFITPNFAVAQNPKTTPKRFSTFDNSAICQASAQLPSKEFAKTLAQKAEIEWEMFGHQTIDNDGKISLYGANEGETNEVAAGSARLNHDVPWYNVYRYWLLLGGGDLKNERFRPFSYENHDYLNPNAPTGGVIGSNAQSAKSIISRLEDDESLSTNDKIVIADALNRAAIIDAPWSGAFISAMHQIVQDSFAESQKPALKFRLSSRHSHYIKQGFLTARGELNNAQYSSEYDRYRACNPETTIARVGDLYCYVRLGAAEKFKKYSYSEDFDIAASAYFNGEDEKLLNTHCDIITNVDLANNKVSMIGGNVYQSVTKKTLNLTSLYKTLAPANYETAKPNEIIDEAICKAENCHLNAKPWFVLLQSRD